MRTPIALTAIAALVVMAGCSGGADPSPDEASGIKLITPGTLTVCTEPPYEPFEVERDGEIVGLDMDNIALVAAEIGPDITVTPLASSFDAIESGAALAAETCDILASAITITPERATKFDFTDPYFEATIGVLTKDDLIVDEATLQDKLVSVQIGTTGKRWADENGLTTREFEHLSGQIDAVEIGDVDAAIGDTPVLTPFLPDGYRLAFEIPTGDQFGYGVSKDNPELLKAANAALAKAKGNGQFAEIYRSWIGVDPPASLLGAVTPEGEDAGAEGEDAAAADVPLISDGKLTVCTNAPYEPFEMEDPASGTTVGFDMDLAALVAAQIGPDVTVEPIATPFETIESGAALNADQCDILASGITITDERATKFEFSQPYFDVNLGVLTADTSISDQASLEGKVVSVQISTTGQMWAQDNNVDSREFKDLGLQVQAMKQGDVQAALGDTAVLAPYVEDSYNIAFEIPTGDQFGIGVKKGNDALLAAVNQAISTAKSDGTYAEIYKRWIGIDPPQALS
ncbi:MAG: transporter substrate-binding domain-containing protein [Bifidobacteriaceae bacterium]|jgi:polar amino acid transport system substrate-binding protein|nr:transporter substrate-binding domain-containing protein [Bifidobacteriaceae bacterium]